MGVNCIKNRGVDGGEPRESLGCIDGKEGVRSEGGRFRMSDLEVSSSSDTRDVVDNL